MPFESKSKCKSIGASLSAAHATRIDTDVMSVHVNAVATATKFTNGSTISMIGPIIGRNYRYPSLLRSGPLDKRLVSRPIGIGYSMAEEMCMVIGYDSFSEFPGTPRPSSGRAGL